MKKRMLCLCLALVCLCLSACGTGVPAAGTPEEQLRGIYYDALEEKEQAAYQALYQGLDRMEKRVLVRLSGKEAFDRVFQAVLEDHPELISVRHQGGIVQRGPILLFEPEYACSREEDARRRARLSETVEAVKKDVLREGMDDFQKELALHDWLAQNCRYDAETLESGADTDIYTAFGALVSGRAVCEGYAKAFALLLTSADIPCTLVSGRARQGDQWESHMWNAVRLGGESYYVDPTWNYNEENPALVLHTYFNVTSEELLRDHEITSGAVEAGAKAQNYFVRRGLRFSQYDDDARAAVRGALEKELTVELSFTSADAYRYAVSKLIKEQQIYSLYAAARPGEKISTIQYTGNEAQYTMLFSGS